ncbi:hypothetical protein D030_1856A, partial [Vibrio parahaemolyticus AQ3810]
MSRVSMCRKGMLERTSHIEYRLIRNRLLAKH